MLLQSQEASRNERNAVRQYVDRGSSSRRAESQKKCFFFSPFPFLRKRSEAGKRSLPARKKRERMRLAVVRMHDQTGASESRRRT